MLRLKTFGGLSLESDRGALGGAAAQRRRLGVLAVLAAAGSRGLTRDKLIGLLWPERDETRARSALSQALYALRRDTGEAELIVGYDRLTLNEHALTSDVQEFESAYRHGGLWVPVVHPFASGRLSRWDVFAQFLAQQTAKHLPRELRDEVNLHGTSSLHRPRRVLPYTGSSPAQFRLFDDLFSSGVEEPSRPGRSLRR